MADLPASFDVMSLPAGLRVLVVETDPEWSKTLEKMLIKCKYKVTICISAREALDLLEKRKEEIDVVMSTDANLPDMDGFMFIKQVGLKMDLPVVVMSLDQDTSLVKKAFQHGACEVLRKPIKLSEVRNIWKHSFKKRVHEMKDVEWEGGVGGNESAAQTPISTTTFRRDNSDDSCSSFGVDHGDDHGKKRKDSLDRSSSLKKPRVVWTPELHQNFMKAVSRIGLDKAGPKKILDFMGVPWLTRENVASHLQKYRLYLSRQHKENGLIASDGMMFSDLQSGAGLSSLSLQQNIVINEPRHELHSHGHGVSLCDENVMPMPMQAPQAEKVLFADVSGSSSRTRIGYNQSESRIQTHYPWTGGAPSLQNRQHIKPHYHLDHYPLVSHVHETSKREADYQPIESNIDHFYDKNRSYTFVTDNNATSNLLPIPPYSHSTGDMYLQNPHLVGIDSFGSIGNQEDFVGDARPELYDPQNIEGEYGSGIPWNDI